MKRTILLALFTTCTAAMAARPSTPASSAVAAPAPAASTLLSGPALNVGPYQLQNRSTFRLSPDTRTPMWPIGWVRPKGDMGPAVAPIVGSGFLLQPHHLKVTGVLMLGGAPLATINGRSFGEGDVLPIYLGERPLKVTLKAIRDGGVFVEQNGRTIFCPIQRKDIPDKAVEQSATPADIFRIKINEK